MCDSKILNIYCSCDKYLIDSSDEIVSLYPCEHLIHLNCIPKQKYCTHCNTKIIKIIKLNDYKSNINYTQQSIDIFSVTKQRISNNKIDIFNAILRIPEMTSIATKLCLSKTKMDYKKTLESIFLMTNVTIKVNGLNKIQNSEKKVFISNHVAHLDPLFLYYVLECGFLSSEKTKPIISFFYKEIPVIYVKRGHKQNLVKLMKEFVDKYGSICIFPEGTISKLGVIYRFKSGAFNIGYPIYPVVLKYNNMNFMPETSDIIKLFLHFGSVKNSIIEITFLDPVYPPFDKKTSEQIRNNMANSGNFLLSRIMANNIKD